MVLSVMSWAKTLPLLVITSTRLPIVKTHLFCGFATTRGVQMMSALSRVVIRTTWYGFQVDMTKYSWVDWFRDPFARFAI